MNFHFNNYGNLDGKVIECNFQEMYDFLVLKTDNIKRRAELVEKLQSFLNDELIQQYTSTINCMYLDGSFCTNKKYPGDIDILGLINIENNNGYNLISNKELHQVIRQYAKDKFEIDFLVTADPLSLPQNINQYQLIFDDMEKHKQAWLDFFCQDRNGNSKAVVKLDVRGGVLI